MLALFLFSRALLPLFAFESGPDFGEVQQGNMTLRVTFLALQAVAIMWAALRWRSFLRAALAHKLTLMLVAVAFLSVIWSTAPDVTTRRAFALAGTTAVGVYLASRYPLRTLVRLLGWTLGISAVLSTIFSLALPDLGVTTEIHEGAWRGIYTHKNAMGQIMVLSAATFFLLWKDARHHRWLPFGGMVLSTLLVVRSTSTTALLILFGLCALIPLYRSLRWHQTLLVPALCFVTVAAVGVLTVLLSNIESISGAFGKDATLTGRTGIWEALLPSLLERPWLGYGYNAFWLSRSGEPERVMRDIGFVTINAHNGYLDIMAGLGGVGLVIFLAGTALALVRSAVLVRRSDDWASLWPLLFLSFLLISNFTESGLLQSNSIFWVLYVAVACSVSIHRPAACILTAPREAHPGDDRNREATDTSHRIRYRRHSPFKPPTPRVSR